MNPSVELERDESSRVRLFLVGQPQPAQLPPCRRPPEHTRPGPHQRLPHRGERNNCFIGRHEANGAAALERLRIRVPCVRQLDLAAPCGDAVPEAAVDRLFARPQRGERLAALVALAQLRVHQRAQHAAPAMCGIDADRRDAGAPELAARHRQLERQRAGPADDLSVSPCRQHPFER